MSIRKSMLLPGLVLMAGCVQAHPRPAPAQACRPAQAAAADAMVDKLNDWAAVDRFFREYRQCDDGGIAEGSSDAVAHLLANQWDTLPKLQALIQREPALRAFVLNHINSTLDTDDLNKIKQNASTSCPPSGASLCAGMRQAVEQALK
jgi:hypothetical protein